MIQIISVQNYEEELRVLERIYLEVSARENILNFMINTNQKDTEKYQSFWEEYLSYLQAYNIIRQEFVANCINKELGRQANGTWSVDFAKKEVTIND